MSLKKQYLKTRSVCKVTFKVPKKAAKGAKTISVVGEFNNWDVSANPMKSFKNGGFSTTIDLNRDREYQFRYLLDDTRWENDWTADKYIPSEAGDCDNSVIVL